MIGIASITMDITTYMLLVIGFFSVIIGISALAYYYTKNNILAISTFLILYLIGVLMGIIPILFLIVLILLIGTGIAYMFIRGVS